MIRAIVALIILAVSLTCGAASDPTPPTKQGRALVTRMCAGCHAISKDEVSTHSAAPPFRILDTQLDLDALADRLRRGLLTGHQDMPMFRYSRDDAHAVVSYLRSIQGP